MFSNKENANASKILVVDDEQDIVTIIDKVLKKSGYEVITASDGLECIDKVISIIVNNSRLFVDVIPAKAGIQKFKCRLDYHTIGSFLLKLLLAGSYDLF